MRVCLLLLAAVVALDLSLASMAAAQTKPTIALIKTTTTTLMVRIRVSPVGYGLKPPILIEFPEMEAQPLDTLPPGVYVDTIVLPRSPRGTPTTVRVCVSPLIEGAMPLCASKMYTNPRVHRRQGSSAVYLGDVSMRERV